jgi:hypothetical protein
MAARRLPKLSLVDALALTLLYAEKTPEKYPRVAARWHARFGAEAKLDLLESQLALSAVMLMAGAGRERGSRLLVDLGRRHGVDLAKALPKYNEPL